MNRTRKIILCTGLLLLAAAGCLGAALAAEPRTQSTTGTASFDAPSGIRWNPAMSRFEVFTFAGLTQVGRGMFVSANGDLSSAEQPGYAQATVSATYRQMCDIVQGAGDTIDYGIMNSAASNFYGVYDGGGYALKNFGVSSGSYFFFRALSGTVKNVNFVEPRSSAGNLSLIATVNEGTISDCVLTGGDFAGNTLYGFANNNAGLIEDCRLEGSLAACKFSGFCATNSGDGILRNCVNNMSYAGGLGTQVGLVCQTNAGLVIDCVNQSSVSMSSDGSVGGIVYQLSLTGRIVNCVNYGKITSSMKGTLAGIAATMKADADASVVGCVNNGEIGFTATGDNTSSLGGIFGRTAETATLNIRNCTNNGAVNAVGGTAGGIAAATGSGWRLAGCKNTGNITVINTQVIGGIAGEDEGSDFLDCTNEGGITVSNGSSSIGGILGLVTGTMVQGAVRGCRNEGLLSSPTGYNDFLGGIVGKIAGGYTLIVEGCTNDGDLSAKVGSENTGGIVGGVESGITYSNCQIIDCVNNGDISSIGLSGSTAGGIFGKGADGTVVGCVNNGTLTVDVSFAGGIMANSSEGNITACMNHGSITNKGNTAGYTGGIAGLANSGKIVSCTNTAVISATMAPNQIIGIGNSKLTDNRGFGSAVTIVA